MAQIIRMIDSENMESLSLFMFRYDIIYLTKGKTGIIFLIR